MRQKQYRFTEFRAIFGVQFEIITHHENDIETFWNKSDALRRHLYAGKSARRGENA